MRDIDEVKIAQLDGSLLLVLRELLRLRRTTLAARRLGLSQSAISHALARLRALFGEALFVRKPYGLEPTRHALELAPQIDALLQAMGEALGLAERFEPARTTREFRIAAPDGITTLIAPGLRKRFARHAPSARFAFSQLLGADAIAALRRDEIELALGRFSSALEGLRVERLFDDPYCVVARVGHPKLRQKLTRASFRELEQVRISVAGEARSLELEPGGALGPERRVVAAVPRFLIAFALVAESDAVVIAPRRLARRYAQSFGLRAHALPFALPPMRALVVRKPQPDPGGEWLVAQLKAIELE